MKRLFKMTAFIAAAVMLTSCNTKTAEESGVSENEKAPAHEQILDVDDILASDDIVSAFDVITDPESTAALNIEMDMSDAYLGTPYQYAYMSKDGTFAKDDSMHFFAMKDEIIAAAIHFSLRDDGTYDYSAGGITDHHKKLNELLTSGKKYVMVAAEDGEVSFAVSEDDEVHLLFDYTYSDETDLSPDITFEEARKFGSVVSLESLTTQVYP